MRPGENDGMSTLEKSVRRLAGALDALEARLDEKIADDRHGVEEMAAARLRARTAKTQAAAAAEDLGDAVRELKAIIGIGGKE